MSGKEVLLSWVGSTDINAMKGELSAGGGPILSALAGRAFDNVVLLCSYGEGEQYRAWLQEKTPAQVALVAVRLKNPTRFSEVFPAARKAVDEVQASLGEDVRLTFHFSPGTPSMAASWVLLAKTRYLGATLVESSREHGVNDLDVPFNIAAEFWLGSDLSGEPTIGRPPDTAKFKDIVFRSPAMRSAVNKAAKAAPLPVTVLIEGESGTGKGLIARAIHGASGRSGAFLDLNCGAIPHELIESELFGHVKGAFTGAFSDKLGAFDRANMGTLFLDEIGELPLHGQVKLLSALQEKTIQRVGETGTSHKVDVRVIAATNRNLLEEVRDRRFREDLFYRLYCIYVQLPPLRQREGDIIPLAESLLEKHASALGFSKKRLAADAIRLILTQQWPGNVRELETTLVRALVESEGDEISSRDIQGALIGHSIGNGPDILGRPLGDSFDLDALLAEVSRHYVDRARKESNGTKRDVARRLGFKSAQALSGRLKSWNYKW